MCGLDRDDPEKRYCRPCRMAYGQNYRQMRKTLKKAMEEALEVVLEAR